MEYSKPVQAEQYSVETSQLVTGHTLSTESYSTALVSLTTCVASPLLYHHTQPCTTRADNKPVQAEQYSVETSQLVTGHTLSTESYSTALVSLTTCVASSLLYHHTQPCTTRADNYCILVWAHGEKKITLTDTNKQ